MAKLNCWEHKKCGRQPGGVKANELGVCSAVTDVKNAAVNSGKSAGRFCWKVAGTLCGGKVQGTYADKMLNCSVCDFYKAVKSEEGASFKM